jgi:hypothetical protein
MPQLSATARKRLAILVLLVGLPVYIVVAMNVVILFERPHFLVELAVYVVLGVVWALPLRWLFLGVAAKTASEGEGEGEAPRRR